MNRAVIAALLMIALCDVPVRADDTPDLGDGGVHDAGAADAAPVPAAPAPLLASTATPPVAAVAHSLRPIHRRPLFWISIASGGLLIGAIVFGGVWAAQHTPRYAVVSF